MSLRPATLSMLDNLAKRAKMNRSAVLDDMIQASARKTLGLSEGEDHSGIPVWKVFTKGDRERIPLENSSGDIMRACTPLGTKGICPNQLCQSYLSRGGWI